MQLLFAVCSSCYPLPLGNPQSANSVRVSHLFNANSTRINTFDQTQSRQHCDQPNKIDRARMKTFRVLLALSVCAEALAAIDLHAQTAAKAAAGPPPNAAADSARARLAPLKWMIGEWTGPATGTNGGQSFAVMQHESVKEAASGTVLMIQGRGSMDGRTVFEAAGLISFDMASQQFKWISSGGTGYLGISEAQVKGDTLIWFTPSGGGSRTRYTIWKSAKGEWREIGEMSRDNQQWTRTFEMTLVTK